MNPPSQENFSFGHIPLLLVTNLTGVGCFTRVTLSLSFDRTLDKGISSLYEEMLSSSLSWSSSSRLLLLILLLSSLLGDAKRSEFEVCILYDLVDLGDPPRSEFDLDSPSIVIECGRSKVPITPKSVLVRKSYFIFLSRIPKKVFLCVETAIFYEFSKSGKITIIKSSPNRRTINKYAILRSLTQTQYVKSFQDINRSRASKTVLLRSGGQKCLITLLYLGVTTLQTRKKVLRYTQYILFVCAKCTIFTERFF